MFAEGGDNGSDSGGGAPGERTFPRGLFRELRESLNETGEASDWSGQEGQAEQIGRRMLRGARGGKVVAGDAAGPRLSLRLRAPDGTLSANQLGVLSDVARRHGVGLVQIVGRNGVEVPGISYEEAQAAQALLGTAGLGSASTAAACRRICVCSGQGKCGNCFVDTGALASAMRGILDSRGISGVARIAVSGCAQGCSCPQTADIGFVGTVEPVLCREKCEGRGSCVKACTEGALVMRRGLPRRDPQRCNFCGDCIAACVCGALSPARLGYTVYVGGRAGRRPQLGVVLAQFLPEEDAPEVAARVLGFLSERARPREHLSSVLRRIGLDALRAHATARLPQRSRRQETMP